MAAPTPISRSVNIAKTNQHNFQPLKIKSSVAHKRPVSAQALLQSKSSMLSKDPITKVVNKISSRIAKLSTNQMDFIKTVRNPISLNNLSRPNTQSTITITPNQGSVSPVTTAVTCSQLERWKKYGEIAQCSYDPKTCSQLSSGQWSHMSPAQLGVSPDLLQEGSYYASMLRNKVTGEMVLTFKGTDDKGDIVDDIFQGVGFTTNQYKKANKLAKELRKNFPTKYITVTGHSLGGGLAALAGLRLSTDTVTFNAAGLHPKVAKNSGLQTRYNSANAYITNVTVNGEILTTLQESGSIHLPGTPHVSGIPVGAYVDPPEAIGRHIVLNAPSDAWLRINSQYTKSGWINKILANSDTVKSATKHRMISVMESIKQQQKRQGCTP